MDPEPASFKVDDLYCRRQRDVCVAPWSATKSVDDGLALHTVSDVMDWKMAQYHPFALGESLVDDEWGAELQRMVKEDGCRLPPYRLQQACYPVGDRVRRRRYHPLSRSTTLPL